jgi:hypothetical protein
LERIFNFAGAFGFFYPAYLASLFGHAYDLLCFMLSVILKTDLKIKSGLSEKVD